MANGVGAQRAGEIFDLMEKFAGYGFNKSHSAAYALLSYQTAWLKAHHPAAFMAAVLSADMDHTDKVVTLIDECRRMDLTLLPPDINRGQHAFTVTDEGAILYGLGAVKGVGEAAIEAIVETRTAGGPFANLFDFCRRIDPRRVNKRAAEALIRVGAFDPLEGHRAALLATLNQAYTLAEQESRAADAGQNDMFGAASADAGPAPTPQLADCPRWSTAERLTAERESLGLWLSGHPIEAYETELRRLVDCRLADVQRFEGRNVRIAGLVVGSRTLSKGRRMTFVTLDDRTARLDVTLFDEQLAGAPDLLARDRLLVVEGAVSVDDFNGGFRIRAEKALPLPAARAGRGASLWCRTRHRAGTGRPADPPGRGAGRLSRSVPGAGRLPHARCKRPAAPGTGFPGARRGRADRAPARPARGCSGRIPLRSAAPDAAPCGLPLHPHRPLRRPLPTPSRTPSPTPPTEPDPTAWHSSF